MRRSLFSPDTMFLFAELCGSSSTNLTGPLWLWDFYFLSTLEFIASVSLPYYFFFLNISLHSVLILDFCLGKKKNNPKNKNTNVRSKTLAKQKASLLPGVVSFLLKVCVQRAQGSIFMTLRSAHLPLHDCKVAFFLGAQRLFSSSLHTCTLWVCVNLTVLK